MYYKYKLQTSIATSTTEAKFIVATTLSKIAKYLYSILNNLDITQQEPTPIFVDNIAVVHIANHNRPTPYTRHIEIS